jgi:citronellol/citronellal dehydrogenase
MTTTDRGVALVTGASSGIGRASAEALARAGFTVFGTSRKTTKESPKGVTMLVCDVTDEESVALLVSTVLSQAGRIDLLVNNAGGQFVAPAEDISPNGWRAVRRLNLDAPWYLTQQVATRWMIANGGGRVISVILCPRRGIAGMAHSSAARAGTETLMQTLAVEWGKHGIGLVCVAPGWIDTEAMRRYGDDPEDIAARVPLRRLGTAEEVGEVIAFLASPAAAYITGTTIVVDGGVENTHG